MKKVFIYFRQHLEGFIWIIALLLLGLMNPENTQQTLCLWHLAGFESCPGCGLGHSISSAFHGDFHTSLKQHPMGIAAIFILLFRIITIFTSWQIFQPFKKIKP
jgi:hypothetical protein